MASGRPSPWASWVHRAWQTRNPVTALLWPVSALLGLWVRRQRSRSQAGQTPLVHLGRPVVVVGNWVVGGAGKTPTLVALAEGLTQRGWRPGIVSKGYGRQSKETVLVRPFDDALRTGDEPLLLRVRTCCPTAVATSREAAAQALLAAHPECDVLLCDDGLQQWNLHRDANLVVSDERGLGNGWLMPAGPLREPSPQPAAGTHVIYNGADVPRPFPGHTLHSRPGTWKPLHEWWNMKGWSHPLPAHGSEITAVCGIGRPARFFDMLRHLGWKVREWPLPDHAPLHEVDWSAIPGTHIVITEKDAVKLTRHPDPRIWVVPLDTALPADLLDLIGRQLAGAARHLPSPSVR